MLRLGGDGQVVLVAVRFYIERLSAWDVRGESWSAGVYTKVQHLEAFRETLLITDVDWLTLRASNRWGGFKALRSAWSNHICQSLTRPILIIDEAQEMQDGVFSELRLLTSKDFDSKSLLCVIFVISEVAAGEPGAEASVDGRSIRNETF